MTTEQRVRDALHEVAKAYSPPSDGWEEIQRRRGRDRLSRRRPVVLASAAAAAVVVVVASMAGLQSDDDSESPRVVDQPDVLASDEIAAVVRQGATEKIVIVDAKSGLVRRTLVELPPSDGRRHNTLSSLDVSPDRRWVYYGESVNSPGHESQLVKRVAMAGGEPETVVEGTAPSVSPQNRLAYIRASGTELAVRDLDTGSETVWASDTDLPLTASPFAWAPDSSALVFQLSMGNTVNLVEPDGMRTVLGESEEPFPSALWTGIWTPFFLSDGRLAAVTIDLSGRWKNGRLVAPLSGRGGMRVDTFEVSGQPMDTLVLLPTREGLDLTGHVDVMGDHILWTARGQGIVRWAVGEEAVWVSLPGVQYAAW